MVTIWKAPSAFSYNNVTGKVTFLLSGTLAFIRGMLSLMPSEGVHRTIASIEFPLWSTLQNLVKSWRFQGQEVLLDFGLRPVEFWDRDCGGATDAIHTPGFSTGLCSNVLPVLEPGLALGLCLFIDGGMEVAFPWTILQTWLEMLATCRQHVSHKVHPDKPILGDMVYSVSANFCVAISQH